jgi:hypothetical protein
VIGQELRRRAEWVRGLTKAEAEELLDWLEAHGAAGALDYEEGRGFAVRCPGLRAEREAGGHSPASHDQEPPNLFARIAIRVR